MCVPNLEFQLLNPTTQVALFAMCIGSCINLQSIKWNVYQSSDNSSSNYTQWTLFNETNFYENIWFFGINTPNFTATNQLFLNNPEIDLWRFEVVYTFLSVTSSSALNFIINQPPFNGSCSIDPSNGTITTVFTVSCPNWFDADGLKDYSLYGRFIFSEKQKILNICFFFVKNNFSLDNRYITKSNGCIFISINFSSSITSWR